MAKKKHLIIGSGSAGLSAAEEIRRINTEDEIKIVSSEDYPPYSPTVLPYLLSGRTDEANLPMRKDNYFDVLGATFSRGKEITRLLPKSKAVVYKDGEQETYDTLLIACGADSSRPPIKGLGESGYLGFHTISDCLRLLKELQEKNNIAVMGAGLVGMEVAIGLVEKGCRVTIIEKEPRLLPLYFDQEAESLIRTIFLNQGINLLTGKEVSKVSHRNGKVSISFAEGSPVNADALVTCTGVAARTTFVEGSGISVNRGIHVDRRMMTNIPDIYAAGDVAEAPDFFTGQYAMNQIIESAVDEGKIAGANMAGEAAEYEGWISSNIFNFFGNAAFSAGLSMPAGNDYQILTEKDDQKPQFKKLVYDDDRLVGAMFLNVDLDPGVILYLMRKKVDISAHKQLLFEQPREVSRWLMLETEEKGSASIQG
jgi:phenylglyoxylate dehydrogenase epsilon subunit